MKINMPVTNNEVVMKDGSTLVSKTNLKGAITYVNRDFIEISGFSEAELVGKNHNIVRHPDMPPEAFDDLWKTIQSGKPWTGYVKNRCKNGDYYWVRADVTPIFHNGQISEFISVRSKPSQQEVAAASEFYLKLKGNRRLLHEGNIVGSVTSLRRKLFGKIKVSHKLGAIGLSIIALCALSILTQSDTTFVKAAEITISLFALFLLATTGRDLLKTIEQASKNARAMGEGKFNNDFTISTDDELGWMLRRLKSMQIRQGFEIEDTRLQAEESLRIKNALDACNTNVMVADSNLNIIYMNKSVQQMFINAEADLKKELPNLDAHNLLGANADIFHKNPAHQRGMIERLRDPYDTQISIANRTFRLFATPVFNDSGDRLGTAIEWNDLTNEIGIQKEMDDIIAAANEGVLDDRIPLQGKTGFFKQLSEGLNTLLDKTSSFVEDISRLFESMSEGDLTSTISNDYSGRFGTIKTNANNSIAKLNQVLLRIQQAAATVQSSANEVAQGSDDLSQRTESQASSLEETASSMEEINATVKQTSDNASQANSLATEAKSKAEAGGEVVQQAVGAMSEILDSSNKINDIIGVIDEIAFQTNLLALNAAVEAARAGEQGRGFAVVAGEVRTLSQRSASAAKEIKDLIRDSVSKVESGSTLVNQSGETLTDIVNSVEKVALMINDVTNAAMEQNSGIGQINQAITQMDSMTQQNAALVEETSAASRSMSEEANNMNSMISFFRLSGSAQDLAPQQVMSHAPSEPIVSYQPNNGDNRESQPTSSVASFSSDDEWEDF